MLTLCRHLLSPMLANGKCRRYCDLRWLLLCLIGLQRMQRSVVEVAGCYAVPNLSARGCACKTNLPPSIAMPGARLAQAVFFTEHCIRAVADFLHVPTAEVSYRNCCTICWHYCHYYHTALLQSTV